MAADPEGNETEPRRADQLADAAAPANPAATNAPHPPAPPTPAHPSTRPFSIVCSFS
jgi:hypothetical protein